MPSNLVVRLGTTEAELVIADHVAAEHTFYGINSLQSQLAALAHRVGRSSMRSDHTHDDSGEQMLRSPIISAARSVRSAYSPQR